jgi:hypothetical protein
MRASTANRDFRAPHLGHGFRLSNAATWVRHAREQFQQYTIFRLSVIVCHVIAIALK